MLLVGVSIPIALYMTSPFVTMVVVAITAIGIFSAYPLFWYLPPTFLTGPGAAGGIALVNTIGAVAGFVAPFVTGGMIDLTGSARTGLWLAGILAIVGAASLVAIRRRIPTAQPSGVATRTTRGARRSDQRSRQ